MSMRKLAALLAALALAVSACGSDSAGDDAAEETTESTEESTESTDDGAEEGSDDGDDGDHEEQEGEDAYAFDGLHGSSGLGWSAVRAVGTRASAGGEGSHGGFRGARAGGAERETGHPGREHRGEGRVGVSEQELAGAGERDLAAEGDEPEQEDRERRRRATDHRACSNCSRA